MVRIPKAKPKPKTLGSRTFEDGIAYVKCAIRVLGEGDQETRFKRGVAMACRVAVEAIETHEQESRAFFRRLDEG